MFLPPETDLRTKVNQINLNLVNLTSTGTGVLTMSVTTVQPAPSEQRERGPSRRWWIPIAAGIGFTLSWVSGLVLPVPNLAPTASGRDRRQVRAAPGTVQAQFALTEGLPALGLAVVAFALARVARRSGSGAERARVMAVAGTVAATISVAQYALGVMLAGWALPDHAAGHASALWQALNRLDGVKMFALAVLAVAAVALTAPAAHCRAGCATPAWPWPRRSRSPGWEAAS